MSLHCHKKKKNNPNKQTPQTKSTPDQNTPKSTNCCKQTQMQEQSFSVAVVADGSHRSSGPPGGAAGRRACAMGTRRCSLGGPVIGRLTFPVSPRSP